MKRIWFASLASVAVIVAIVATATSSGVTAQSDDVPALETRVAALETQVAVLSSGAVSIVIDSGSGTTFKGTGHQVIDVGELATGTYLVQVVYKGTGEDFDAISVQLTGKSTVNWELIVNGDIAPIDFKTVLRIPDYKADEYLLEVDAAGDWTVTIQPA